MMEKFYGDTVRWFLGMVINNVDPFTEPTGRVQVRIYGIHDNVEKISNSNLPWAVVLLPATEGGVDGIGRSPDLKPGAQVFGIFLDGEDSQLPLVLGSIPRVSIPQNIDTTTYNPGNVPSATAPIRQEIVSDITDTVLRNVLTTIKTKESSNNYTAVNFAWPQSTATGAYQFVRGTWRGAAKIAGVDEALQYRDAKDAPPEIQDRVAGGYISDILAKNGNNVAVVPLVWFTGNARGYMSAHAIQVNRGMTGSDYQREWMKVYNTVSGGAV